MLPGTETSRGPSTGGPAPFPSPSVFRRLSWPVFRLFYARRPRGYIAARPRPGKVKKRAARASKRRENRPGPDPQNGTRKHIFIYTHFKPGFSNVNPGNVNILPKQKYLKYRTGGGKYERIQRKIRARDAGTVDGEKARSALARPRDRSRRIVYMYLCIRIRELYTGIHCIQVSRYAMPSPPALHFAKALKCRFSAKKSPFCDLSVLSEKVEKILQSCKNVIKII